MKDLTKTASILDTIIKILSVCIKIAAVAMLAGLGILAAGFLFDLPPQIVGTGYDQADLGFITLTVSENYMPDHRIIWAQAAAEMFLVFLCLIPAHFIAKSIRAILSPMKNGEPFHNTVSIHLEKISRYVCSLGIGMNLVVIISNILLVKAFDLHLLLLSEKIPHVDFLFTFDFSFLLVSGILLLLSYVFRYGEELQQLSDETL